MAADNEGTFVLVHGGGAEVTAAAKQFGIESQFVDGVRFTSMREMAVVDAVLAGKINKELVRQIRAAGLNGVGLSGSDGGLFTGAPVQPDSCTGKVTETDTRLLHLLTENGYTPVIATTSMTADGFPLNINADEAALTLAAALKADQLIFISDIPRLRPAVAERNLCRKRNQRRRHLRRYDSEGQIGAGCGQKRRRSRCHRRIRRGRRLCAFKNREKRHRRHTLTKE